MKHLKLEATTGMGYGKKLAAPITFQYEADVYETVEEMFAAKAGLTPMEQLKARNTQLQNKARSNQQTLTLAAHGIAKPDIKQDFELQVKKFELLYKSIGYSDEMATAEAVKAATAARDAVKAAKLAAGESDDDEADDATEDTTPEPVA